MCKELRATLIRLLDLSMRKMRDPRQRKLGTDGDPSGERSGLIPGKGSGGIKAKITRGKPHKRPANVNRKAGKKTKAA